MNKLNKKKKFKLLSQNSSAFFLKLIRILLFPWQFILSKIFYQQSSSQDYLKLPTNLPYFWLTIWLNILDTKDFNNIGKDLVKFWWDFVMRNLVSLDKLLVMDWEFMLKTLLWINLKSLTSGYKLYSLQARFLKVPKKIKAMAIAMTMLSPLSERLSKHMQINLTQLNPLNIGFPLCPLDMTSQKP